MTTKPKISFVVGIRNPDYGYKYGMNNQYRTQLFVDNLVFLCNKYKLLSELIFVEWNPEKTHCFYSKLAWPISQKFLKIYWVKIPSKIHCKFKNAKTIPIFEFIAKNVGIRKAKGEYIVSTNPDLLYTESLVKYLSQVKLSNSCFYRIDRLDVAGYIPKKLSIKDRLKFCSSHAVKMHTFYGSIKPNKKSFLSLQNRKRRHHLIQKYWSGKGLVSNPDGLHRNASGDFFMMKNKLWKKLKGYAEITTHSHIDSIMCWQASTLNLKQIIIPEKHKLYHIDHSRKIHKKFPQTNWKKWYSEFKKFKLAKKILVVNDSNWGLSKEHIEKKNINFCKKV